MELFFNITTVFIIGLILGVCLAAVCLRNADDDYDLHQIANRDAAELLTYLETSECNLFYNPVINSWGLVDGKDTLIAAASSVKATLRRAQSKDRAELQAAQSSTF